MAMFSSYQRKVAFVKLLIGISHTKFYLSAQEQKFDVVLIDTAGRMQDNEPLMRALAKLITINHPDLVLFVGQ